MLLTGDYSKLKYTSQYVDLINKGEIIIGKKVKRALERVLHYIDKYEFDQDAVDKKIEFIENETSQTKGSHEKLILALPQKVWLEIPWGFYVTEEIKTKDPQTMEDTTKTYRHRVIHQVPIMMGRGNGKTTLASAIGIVGQIIDGEYGSDVQILASTRTQASYAYEAVRAMISRKGTLLYKLSNKKIIKSTKQGIMFTKTNSLMSIKTSDYETLDGTNAHYNIFDEVHAYKEDFIKVVSDGSAKKRMNWISWFITTNGTIRGATFDDYYDLWTKVLNGDIDDDTIFPFLYEIDSIDDVKDADTIPEKTKNFQKANPMIGIMPALTVESILRDMVTNRGNQVAQKEILAKTFNFPTEAHGAFFSNDEILGNPELYDEQAFKGKPDKYREVIIGVDLSQVNDIASLSLMTIYNDVLHFKTFNFLPRDALSDFSREKRMFLEQMADAGHLIIHDDNQNQSLKLYEYVKDYMETNYIRPIVLAPDPWYAEDVIASYSVDYPAGQVEEIRQGALTLSKPMQSYKQLLKSKKITWNNALINWAHANVIAEQDVNLNVKPSKKKSHDKIDPFAAQLDAYTAYFNMKNDFLRDWVGEII